MNIFGFSEFVAATISIKPNVFSGNYMSFDFESSLYTCMCVCLYYSPYLTETSYDNTELCTTHIPHNTHI